MGSIVAQLIPLVIGAALAPIWIIIVLLLLRRERGLVAAVAFVAGMTVVRLIQGFVFGVLLSGVKAGGSGEGPGLIASTLLLVLGILLWVTAVRKYLKEEDPDAPPPKWLSAISEATPLKAFGLGAALMGIAIKMWVFTLSAIGVIRTGGLEPASGVVAFLIYILLAQSLLLAAILMSAIVPRRSAVLLGAAAAWLEQHNTAIMIGIGAVFGTYFVWKGASGLLG